MTDWWSSDPPPGGNWWKSDAPPPTSPQGILGAGVQLGLIPKSAATMPKTTTPAPVTEKPITQGMLQDVVRAAMTPRDAVTGALDPESPEGVGRMFDAASIFSGVSPARLATPKTLARPVTRAEAEAAIPPPTRESLEAAAKGDYKKFDEGWGGHALPSTMDTAEMRWRPAVDKAIEDTVAKLEARGVPRHRAEGIYKSLDRLRDATSVSKVHEAIQDITTTFGERSATNWERNGARIATEELRSFLGRIEPSGSKVLERATGNRATAFRMEELETAAELGGFRSGKTVNVSGGQTVQRLRNTLTDLVEQGIKGNPNGFRDDELAAIRSVAEGSNLINAALWVGKFSPTSHSTIPATVGAFTLGIPAALANKLATVLTERQMEQLGPLLAKRSPAYETAVSKAVNRYVDSRNAFVGDPTSAKFLALVTNSRNLANGLTRDGIGVTSGDLIKAITGPARSGAEEEGPPVPQAPYNPNVL